MYRVNAYLFTGQPSAPTFLSSGDTNLSLNPNYTFPGGTVTLGFALSGVGFDYLGINFFFNGSLTPGISAVVPAGSSSFSAISGSTSTVGLGSDPQGSGSLSFASAFESVTLTGYSFAVLNPPNSPGVDNYFTTGGGANTVGPMTFVAVPEPSTVAVLLGVVAGVAVLGRRFAVRISKAA
jgi:hypothetical protein